MFDIDSLYKKGNHWLGVKPNPNKYFGFLYAILNIKNNMLYVGKKQYLGKRTRKNGTVYYVNNKWEFYTGSSKVLNKDIDILGKEFFVFMIIKNIKTEDELGNEEELLQRDLDVLRTKVGDNFIFYNKNINGSNYIASANCSEATLKKFSENTKGAKNPMFGKNHKDEAKKKIGAASKERGISDETRNKIFETKRDNTKVYKFIHNTGNIFIGTVQNMLDSDKNTKHNGIKELIRGKNPR